MAIDLRIVLTIAAATFLVLGAWVLRPQRSRDVSSDWAKLRTRDPFFFMLYDPTGHPRKYAWSFPVVFALLFAAITWMM
jgi:hypothetical protein